MTYLKYLLLLVALCLLAACGDATQPQSEDPTPVIPLDNTVPDGDGATPIGANALSFGNVCAGSTTTRTALIGITRQGNGNVVYKNSTTVTISQLSITGAGLSQSLQSTTVAIPANWSTSTNGTVAGTVASDVTFVAGSAGPFSGSITYRGAGINANNTANNRDGTLPVTATVINCNQSPVINIQPMTFEGDTPGGWNFASFSLIGTASDAEDTTPSVSCTPAVGSVLPIGANSVTCTATDSGGLTATATGTISVTDTVAPVLTVSNLTVEGNAVNGATVTFSATATDTVDATPTVTCSAASGDFFALGTTAVSCTASDDSNNSSTGSFDVTVVDTTAPTLSNVPTDITVEGDTLGGAIVSYTNPSASDSVDANPVVSCTPASGTLFAAGTTPTPVTCTATDATGNVSSASFNVTVTDTTPPTLVGLSGDITAEATGADGATVSYTSPTATDAIDPNPSVSCTPASDLVFAIGTTPVTCSATDASGNSVSASFNVIVQDTTAPALTLPAPITAEASDSNGAVVSFTASANDLVDGSVTPVCDRVSPDTFALGDTTVTCSATDSRGNSSSGSFLVTVVDTTLPVLTLPSDISVEASSAAGAVVTFEATASDTVSGNLAVSCNPASGSTFGVGTTPVSCSATDGSGNNSTGSFTVTVSDSTAPTLSNMPGNITAEAASADGATVTFTSPTASDANDPNPTVTCTPTSGGVFPLGDTTVSCTASDASGNTSAAQTFVVSVVDTTAPGLSIPDGTLSAEATSSEGATVTFDATANDLVDSSVEISCTPASGSSFAFGTTSVTCTATDDSGNTATDSFDVLVVDTTAPALTVPANASAEATSSSGAVVTFEGATATDAADANPAVTCSAASGDTFPLGTTSVSCTATDASGNSSTGSFSVTVSDTTAPTLADLSNVAAEANAVGGATVSYTSPAASDLVDPNPAVTCTPVSDGFFPLGDTTVSCASSDAAGNSSPAKTFSVSVVDTTDPVLSVPGDINTEATSASGAAVEFSATATDIADADVTVSCAPASGSTFAKGTTPVTCTATDDSGNSSEDSFSVTVGDSNAPVLSLPGDISVEATGSNGATVTFEATASDSIDGSVAVTCMPASGSTFALGNTTVSCSATDSSGNSSSGSFVVTVTDTTDPVITFVSRSTEAGVWTNQDVTLTWSCTDNVGVVNETVSVTVSAEGADQSATGTCEDTSGRTASNEQNGINLDKTAPMISASRTPDANGNGWNNGNVTASYTASDDRSGLNAASAASGSHDFTTEGAGQAQTFTVTDNAGNTASASVENVSIDKTAPTLNPVVTPNSVVVGGSASVAANAADALSGLALEDCGALDTSSVGSKSVTCTATDKAGNTAGANASYSVVAPADTTPPVITRSITGTLGTNGWYRSTVTVFWTISDPESAVTTTGCGTLVGTSNGVATWRRSVVTDTVGVTLNCSATSGGGTTPNSITIKRDGTKPTIAYDSSSPLANANGWNNTSVTVKFRGNDATSGIASCPDRTISAEATKNLDGTFTGKTVNGSCTDNAGNVVTLVSPAFNIDKTKPVVGVTMNGIVTASTPTYSLASGVPTVGCSSTDALSGVANAAALTVVKVTTTGEIPVAIPVTAIGTYKAKCQNALDNAGNANGVQITFKVIR
jgi:large repetitive protein